MLLLRPLVLLGLTTGCVPSPGHTGAPADVEPVRAGVATMQRHFAASAIMRAAAQAGEPDTIREVAAGLRDGFDPVAFPQPWSPAVTAFDHALQAAQRTANVREGAQMVAAVGRACGDCHVEAEAPVALGWPAEPDPEQRMDAFAYAAELLWLGLMTPSQQAWAAGATAYHAALSCEGLAEVPIASYHGSHCSSLRVFGAAVLDARDAMGRQHAYAGVLATCAGCHAARGPESGPGVRTGP